MLQTYKEEIIEYFNEYKIKWEIELSRVYLIAGKFKEARNILTRYRETKHFKRRWRKFYLMSLMPNFIIKNVLYLNEIKNKVLKRI